MKVSQVARPWHLCKALLTSDVSCTDSESREVRGASFKQASSLTHRKQDAVCEVMRLRGQHFACIWLEEGSVMPSHRGGEWRPQPRGSTKILHLVGSGARI